VRKGLPGLHYGDGIVGTEEGWSLTEAPARLAVVGAGASGSELASAYARLGSEVTLIEALDRVLPGEDADVSKAAARGFKKQGIDVLMGNPVSNVERDGSVTRLTVGEKVVEADLVVVAAGRGPDVEGLGLDTVGIKLDERGLIEVDGAQRTSVEGIWAIGDLCRGPALAHKASEEGILAAEDASGMATHPIVYEDIPRATFCTPNVASFGLTEQQAKDAGYDVVVGKVQYGAVGAGTVYGDRTGIIKIIGDAKYGELLGGHICGAKAPELIQELVNAKALEGGYPEVARIIHGHPTLSEGISEAARAADGWLIHG
jgi:dihydrolipoamide dehydrogenase